MLSNEKNARIKNWIKKMYITGVVLENDLFKSIYSIFDNKQSLENWLKIIADKKIKLDDENIETIQIKELKFPILIIETYREKENICAYKFINNNELFEIINKENYDSDMEKIYLNVWKIDNNLFNEKFLSESCLTGRIFHIHIKHNDIIFIRQNGIEKYFESVD